MKKSRSNQVFFYSIIGLLALGAGTLFWASSNLSDRQKRLSDIMLRRSQQILNVRLDGIFREMAEELREESIALERSDSTVVMDRWMPLLKAHWPILSIKLATEHGDEVALFREDSTFLLRRTVNGSKDGPPILTRYSGTLDNTVAQASMLDTVDMDPRKFVWFSKALEDSRNEPCWTLRPIERDEAPLLQVSYLIRQDRKDLPFRVLMFTVDLQRSTWMDPVSSSFSGVGLMLLDGQGRSICDLGTNADDRTREAISEATSRWQRRKTSIPFTVKTGEQKFRCAFSTYSINGQQLHSGVVLDMDQVDKWLAPERNGLLVVALFLLALTLLLAWGWRRQRTSDQHIKKQDRRTRTQELKLAKALGEREVLNREVHHRVKNNLQIVSSLLSLQATHIEDGAGKDEFMRGKRRIDTIALVHHKLYALTDMRNVDLNRFFIDIVKALAEMHLPHSRTVSFDVDANHVKADQDTAIEIGIILCELVSNTYEHAFPYATGGHVEIRVIPVEGDLYRLTVQDNGKGIPEGQRSGSGKLGLEIVDALSDQLDGSFHMRTDNGVHFEVLFRMKHTVTTDADPPTPES